METPAWAVVDLAAVRHNVALLREKAAGAQLMAVVKADAYGHGMVPCAVAALEAGADWLGVAQVREALALRAAGITAPVLCMMAIPGEFYEEAIKARVDVSAGSTGVVTEIARAAARAGQRARVHLKADTGLSRGGATAERVARRGRGGPGRAGRWPSRGHRALVPLRLC